MASMPRRRSAKAPTRREPSRRARGRRLPGRLPVVYTVGYGGRSPESLVQLLEAHKVKVVCDVRFSPRSRFVPWANYYVVSGDGPLKRLIEGAGFEYRWVGDQLGNPEPKDTTFRRFKALMSREGRWRLAGVRALIARRTVCLLCAAKDLTRCHRRVITERLEARGHRCVHL